DLVVRGESGQHAGGVQVVEELAAHLEVELAADLPAALMDVVRLQFHILLPVEAGRPDRLGDTGRGTGRAVVGTGDRAGGALGGAGGRFSHADTLAPGAT